MRCDEPGWDMIGSSDSTGRRGVWIRVRYETSEDGFPIPSYYELAGGREGDDSYARVEIESPVGDVLSDWLLAREMSADADPTPEIARLREHYRRAEREHARSFELVETHRARGRTMVAWAYKGQAEAYRWKRVFAELLADALDD